MGLRKVFLSPAPEHSYDDAVKRFFVTVLWTVYVVAVLSSVLSDGAVKCSCDRAVVRSCVSVLTVPWNVLFEAAVERSLDGAADRACFFYGACGTFL